MERELTLKIIAKEAYHLYGHMTGVERPLRIRESEQHWYHVASSRSKTLPVLEIEWPHGYAMTIDQALPLLRQLLAANDAAAWESEIEARLQKGALAYQNAADNFAIALYRRVHL